MNTRKPHSSPTIEPDDADGDKRASIRKGYKLEVYTSGAFLPDELKQNVPEGGVFQDTADDARLSQSEWVYNNPRDFFLTKYSVTQ